MVSSKKHEANKANAKLSKGPKDTSKTRFNASKHGILSKESFISAGDGQEDVEEFEELSKSLRHDLAPNGALEELLVDELIMLTWRRRRVLRYEIAAIRRTSDAAIEDWEQEQNNGLHSFLAGGDPWQSTEDLASDAKQLNEDLQALSQENPI